MHFSGAATLADVEAVPCTDDDVDVELATPLITPCTAFPTLAACHCHCHCHRQQQEQTDKQQQEQQQQQQRLSLPSLHSLLLHLQQHHWHRPTVMSSLSGVRRVVSVPLLLLSLLVLCYWSVRLLLPASSLPAAVLPPVLSPEAVELSSSSSSSSSGVAVAAPPSFPTSGLYLPVGWSPSSAVSDASTASTEPSPSSELPSVRIAFRAHGWWFRGVLEWAGHSLFRNFSVVEWDPALSDVWVVQSFLGGEQPGPDSIDRSRGQRRLFVSGEPLEFGYLSDFDAIIDTKRVPFTRPTRIHAVYLPYYAAAVYELGSAVQLLKPVTAAAYSGELAHNLTHRRFAAYMQGHCVSYRDQLFERLERYKHVDGLGKCKHNVAGDEEAAAAGSWQAAVQVYSRYKFVLCMENSMQPGYITEKILTVMLARAIPVYIGAPDIALHFDERSFIHLLSYASVDEAVERIAQLDSNHTAYMEMLAVPWMSGNRLNAWLTNRTQHNLFYQQMRHLRDVLTAPGYTYTDASTPLVAAAAQPSPAGSSSGGGSGGGGSGSIVSR